MVVVLLMFGIFGSSTGSLFTGRVVGSPLEETDTSTQVEDILIQAIEKETSVETQTVSSLEEEGKYTLLLNILKLKSLDKKVTKLQFAEKVSSIAIAIESLNNNKVSDKWDSMILCLETNCGEQYYELFNLVVDETLVSTESNSGFFSSLFSKVSKFSYMPDLLKSVVDLEKATDSGNLIDISKATTAVNSLISKTDSSAVQDLWNELIACDFKCLLYDNLLLELVKYRLEQF